MMDNESSPHVPQVAPRRSTIFEKGQETGVNLTDKGKAGLKHHLIDGGTKVFEEVVDTIEPIKRPCRLIGNVRESLPVSTGRARRIGSHYERRGICHVLMAFEPLRGWREVEITERRRGKEFAHSMRRLAEEIYPRAGRIRMVCDNLSTHTAAFYETFAAEIAHRLARKIEFVYTARCIGRG